MEPNAMLGQIVDIEYEDGDVEIAKIVDDTDPEQFMVASLIYRSSVDMFRFSARVHPVPRESVAGFYDTTELEDTGMYTKVDELHYQAVDSSESDYDSDDSSSSTDTEVSLDSE